MKKTILLLLILFMASLSCQKEKPPVIEVKTLSAVDIMVTSATLKGEVIDIGLGVTDYGHCWAEHSNPEITDYSNKYGPASSTKSFNTEVNDLKVHTKYYFRAWAKGKDGKIKYGDILDFLTSDGKAVITTSDVSDIELYSAICGGNITSAGGSEILFRGICWSTSRYPTTADNKTNDGSGTGSYTSAITGLNSGPDYYVRAYATTNYGTYYGQQITFSTRIFTDARDGNNYQWIKIGEQIWMAENLAYLPLVSPASSESITAPYYYVYGYNGTNVSEAKATSNYTTYGVLYNWPAGMNGAASSTANPSGVQGVCPTGWHLPSEAEWTELRDYLGGISVAGGKLKETGTTHWNSPNTGATNASGFTALPGGQSYDGTFSNIGSCGRWWSATGDFWNTTNSRFLDLYAGSTNFLMLSNYKDHVFSVRCVRD